MPTADRQRGLTSRLHRMDACRPVLITDGVLIDLPITVDLVHVDPHTRDVLWAFEAIVDFNDELIVRSLNIRSRDGLDVVRLQNEFRWATPLDIVGRLVPRMLAEGEDIYSVDLPVSGYPESAGGVAHDATGMLTDEFLESIAREYLRIGRGYADELSTRFLVSRRTVVSWVEKARRRGILTPVRPGQFGGELVPSSRRRESNRT